MADLSALLRIAPTTAAGFIGQDFAQEKAMADVQRQRQILEMQHLTENQALNKEKHPLELEKLRLANQSTEMGLPGILEDLKTKQLNNQQTAGTMQTTIDAGNAKNINDIMEREIKNFGRYGAQMQNLPEGERFRWFANQLNSKGITGQYAQQVLQQLSNVSPKDLPAHLNMVTERFLKDNPEYVREQMKEEGHLTRTRETIKGQQALEMMKERFKSSERVAKEGDVAKQLESTVMKAFNKGPRAMYSALNAAASLAKSNGMDALAVKYAAAAEEIRPQAEAETANLRPKPGEPDINTLTDGQVPTAPSGSITPPSRAVATPGVGNNGRVRVISPDGKVGTIPREQLEAARKQGYKEQK